MAYERNQAPAETEVLNKTEARQAVTGHNARYVLYWGLGGVIVAFLIVYFFFVH